MDNVGLSAEFEKVGLEYIKLAIEENKLTGKRVRVPFFEKYPISNILRLTLFKQRYSIVEIGVGKLKMVYIKPIQEKKNN